MNVLVALGLSLSGMTNQSEPLTRFTFTQYHMGIDARIVVYSPDEASAEKACAAAFARIAVLDSIMSDYRKDSELMKLCDGAGGPAVKVSPDLFLVLKHSVEMSRNSGGAFDISVGPLVQLWRAARRSKKLPDPGELRQARDLVGWQRIRLNLRTRTVALTAKGMKLDLGGIAKGFAADEAQKVLRRHGITRALVEMGGDLVMSGPPPGTDGWTIRVPNAGDDQGPADLKFANCAVSTSGDTEQFVEIGGVRYSHVVDPRTGQALTNRVQVTVKAPHGLVSDPLSTALTLVSPKVRAEMMKAYLGTTSYVRVLAFGAPP